MRQKMGSHCCATTAALPQEMETILHKGLVVVDDCVLLKQMLEKSGSQRLSSFADHIDFETFVNHIHVEDYAKSDLVAIALSFLERLSPMLAGRYPEMTFRGVVAFSIDEQYGTTCTVRFYTNREDKAYLAEEAMEGYSEAVCLLDLGV
jgi:hypothetical protein